MERFGKNTGVTDTIKTKKLQYFRKPNGTPKILIEGTRTTGRRRTAWLNKVCNLY